MTMRTALHRLKDCSENFSARLLPTQNPRGSFRAIVHSALQREASTEDRREFRIQ
jgi:hypothetical protein